MKAVIEAVLGYVGLKKARLGDFVDSLCSRYTPMLLVVFIFVTGISDNFGAPINCMTPQEFPATWNKYVHQYCYVTGTYVKLYKMEEGERVFDQRVYVHYYQWVPYVLIILALALRLPLCFWRFGLTFSDVDFGHINEFCTQASKSVGKEREERLGMVTDHIYQAVLLRNSHNGLGSVVSCFYVFYKLMNIVIVFAQIYLLNLFVGYSSWNWGLTLFQQTWTNINADQQVQVQGQPNYFPRNAYCYFGRDFLGSVDGGIAHEVRCTIGMNMLNEKVFLCLFFWYYSLFALLVFHAIFHVRHLLTPFRVLGARSFLTYGSVFNINKGRRLADENNQNCAIMDPELGKQNGISWSASTNRCGSRQSSTGSAIKKLGNRQVSRFMDEWLGLDGLLLLRWIRQNAGMLVAAEVATRLYHRSLNAD